VSLAVSECAGIERVIACTGKGAQMIPGRGGEGMRAPIVLAVDDHDETLDLIERALAGQCQKFFRARSGPDAIGLLMSTRIDVVVLDLDMPEMTGIAVLEVIRYIPRLMHLQVIVQASPSDLHNVKRARRLGARAVLEKPLSPDAVLQGLQSVLSTTEELALVGGL
jgi:CheY-like chemotaxis protein